MADTQKRPTEVLSEAELSRPLASSAFEFLQRAIAEFDQSAKFSTVHFAIAIELFLKARLMKEHWALLLDKPDQGDRAAFFRGEAKTVTPEQAIERLKKIAGVAIPQHSKEIFSKIAQHRNKMVHFVHTDDRADDPNATAQIVAEQCSGWLSLRILLESWPEFEAFSDEIREVGRQMERHRAFLSEKFKSKADELKEHREDGLAVAQCPSCKFLSVRLGMPVGAISQGSCVVCWYSGSEVALTCIEEDCKQKIVTNSYEGPPDACPHCNAAIDENYLIEALETGEGSNYDNYFDQTHLNCSQCSGYHTGVTHHTRYICVRCFDSDDEMGICGYCSEGQIGGVSDHSYLTGCENCEGSAGNLRDD